MKSKLKIFVLVLFLSIWALTVNAQPTIPNGKAKLIEFTNKTSKFTVPDGKAWIIYSIFSDFIVDGDVIYDKVFKKKCSREH